MTAERLTDEELDRIERAASANVGHRGKSHAQITATPENVLADIGQYLALQPGETVLRLVTEVRASRALLAELEWAGVDVDERAPICPICWSCGEKGMDAKHAPGCALAAALGRTSEPRP